MSLSVEIQKKQTGIEKRKITTSSDVYELEEVQEIKDAVQEHLLFIGLDNKNNVRNVTLLGIGSSSEININSRDAVRTALVTASNKVILVHNHPSNELKPSIHDIDISNTLYKLLKVFNIELLDHIIVSEEDYISMVKLEVIDMNYDNEKIKLLDNTLLIEENALLKENIKELTDKVQKYEQEVQEDEEEFE